MILNPVEITSVTFMFDELRESRETEAVMINNKTEGQNIHHNLIIICL